MIMQEVILINKTETTDQEFTVVTTTHRNTNI